MQLYREGRYSEALARFDRALAADANDARSRGMRGFTLNRMGDYEGAARDLAASVARAPRDAMMQTGLGMVLIVLDRIEEAEAALRRALVIAPNEPHALANLSLALRSRGDFAGAERAARNALLGRPAHMEARTNLAYALLAQGKYADAWPELSARPDPRANPRAAGQSRFPHASSLPAPGEPVIVEGEQGLGDTLFFLRFAPWLRERGHRLAFWGDARLDSMLARTNVFEHFLRPEAAPGENITLVWCGDLPHFLAANDPTRFPPALPLPADPDRQARWREKLAAAGPAPHIGVTWRAGIDRRGRLGLSKQLDPATLGAALAGHAATWVSLQRKPAAGEGEAFARASGARFLDASSVNDDLEEALALVSVLDDYVGVSNTNTHLRASAGKAARVLIPWPPEWRWLADAERSPWFPAMRLYRQASDGDWSVALGRLRRELQAP